MEILTIMKGDILFYVTESKFGCSQPVRSGDLIRVKKINEFWYFAGKLALVLSRCSEGHLRDDCAAVIIDGKKEIVMFAFLEWISDEN